MLEPAPARMYYVPWRTGSQPRTRRRAGEPSGGRRATKMGGERIPGVILAGSDRRPATLPESGRDAHPLVGYKGVRVQIGGRPLIATLVERMRATGEFDPIYVVGPAAAYDCVRDLTRLIDSDGTLAQNARRGCETAWRNHPGSALAFITCDVLPAVEDVRRLVASYRAEAPCDLWFPLIEAPEDRDRLGPSAWKPDYRIVPQPGQPAVRVLPCHLAIADPEALRLRFLYRLIDVAYRTRNRPIHYRRTVMVRGVVAALLYQDLLHLLGGRMPSLTWSVLSTGISVARGLKRGRVTLDELEVAVRRILVNHRHRKRHPQRRVRLPIVDALSLALDIDTEEEARAVGGRVAPYSA